MIWQLDVNREDYLVKYAWLRIEGDGAKWYCWACHDYGGAKDKLGTTKARPSRQEKLTEHAKNSAHIEAMRMHEAKSKRARQADEVSSTLFAYVDPKDVVTFKAVASCVRRKISPLQHTAAEFSLLREHGVGCRKFKQLWARMLSMFTAQFPLILRVVAIAMTFTTDTSGCERLISLMNDLQTVFQSRMGHDCLRSQMWWSAEMHRLTYSEWQSALPRMVRRWNKNRRHQCDDDAASTAAAVSEAEAHARCDLVSACTAEQSCKIDSYADLCGL